MPGIQTYSYMVILEDSVWLLLERRQLFILRSTNYHLTISSHSLSHRVLWYNDENNKPMELPISYAQAHSPVR